MVQIFAALEVAVVFAAPSASGAAEKPCHSSVAAVCPDSAADTAHHSDIPVEAVGGLGVHHSTDHCAVASPDIADLDSNPVADHDSDHIHHSPADTHTDHHEPGTGAVAVAAGAAAAVAEAAYAGTVEGLAIAGQNAGRIRTAAAAGAAAGVADSGVAAEDSRAWPWLR